MRQYNVVVLDLDLRVRLTARLAFTRSERENRAIDHDEEGSMELKKREGYF